MPNRAIRLHVPLARFSRPLELIESMTGWFFCFSFFNLTGLNFFDGLRRSSLGPLSEDEASAQREPVWMRQVCLDFWLQTENIRLEGGLAGLATPGQLKTIKLPVEPLPPVIGL